jgi:hypothetical protein
MYQLQTWLLWYIFWMMFLSSIALIGSSIQWTLNTSISTMKTLNYCDENFKELVYGVFFIWSPWTFWDLIVFHISIVMCCLRWIPFYGLGGLPPITFLHWCFVSLSLCWRRRFIVAHWKSLVLLMNKEAMISKIELKKHLKKHLVLWINVGGMGCSSMLSQSQIS